jgi:sulfide:quinone oxidoreductase
MIVYDYLVIALGAELAMDAIPGLAESAHTFYTFEGSQLLRDALRTFEGGSVAVVVSSLPYKCPGAPHEGAMLIADAFRKRGLREKVQVTLYTPEPAPMPVAGPELGNAVVDMLGSKGISFLPQHKLREVDAPNRRLIFEGKQPVPYDLLVAIPPHRSPVVVRALGLANEGGWIPVDRSSLKTSQENIFAIGDVSFISIPGRWKPDVPMALPKAGVFAHGQALIVAHNIASQIAGSPSAESFCGGGYCMLEAGEDMAGFAFGDFFGEPAPQVHLRKMGRSWHLGKVLFEKWWLSPPGMGRTVLGLALRLGAKVKRIPIDL